MKNGRIVLCGSLNLISPMLIGSGKADLCDRDVLLDSDGRAFIPATSFMGVLSRLINDGKHNGYLGLSYENNMPLNQSYLICDDLYPTQTSSSCVIRDGIRIDKATGVVEDKAKFDYQVVEPGLSFDFKLEFVVNSESREEEAKEIVAKCLTVFDDALYVGGKRSSGFGKLIAQDIHLYEYDFDITADLAAYLIRSSSEDKLGNYKPRKLPNTQFVIKADFRIPHSLIVRSYPKNAFGPDASHIQSAGKYVLPATSLRGALRARAHRIMNTIWDQGDEVQDFLDSIFGNAKTSGKRYSIPSSLQVDELTIDDVVGEVQNRVCIDRFTGGTIEGALFDSMPVFPKDGNSANISGLNLCLQDPLPSQKGLLLLLLKDLYTGDLAIGGEKNIGRGTLLGLKAGITDEEHDPVSINSIEEMASQQQLESYVDALLQKSDLDAIRKRLAIFRQTGV
ncbi:MAG: RAMP superfamily CRISPR-associated protein [Candidatus Cloacimonadaceae bacterium]|jgi:CRISPR/Cas system CSM-associated protein Csm3 (group 7 of RAMP superfamily)|nr:RAMP superfamily CRISPR-associated protein [Candidatus Cloacimonadota bacterium]MCK9241796.1 RAMP superfamily CRISPR-associated protein [Candidatus Cloacimonadota bacterium]MDY0126885.1 RAMP superfamily CRISPR-associated protein [Candidatus Cloacimonadaceae bacterium]